MSINRGLFGASPFRIATSAGTILWLVAATAWQDAVAQDVHGFPGSLKNRCQGELIKYKPNDFLSIPAGPEIDGSTTCAVDPDPRRQHTSDYCIRNDFQKELAVEARGYHEVTLAPIPNFFPIDPPDLVCPPGCFWNDVVPPIDLRFDTPRFRWTETKLNVLLTSTNTAPQRRRLVDYSGVLSDRIRLVEEFGNFIFFQTALWSASHVLGQHRYGCADTGRDDWVRARTMKWLQDNLAALPPVDDISGEHGFNIVHSEKFGHQNGTGVDVCFFGARLAGQTPGVSMFCYKEYNALVSLVARAAIDLNGDDIASRNAIHNWLEAQRKGLLWLIGDERVRWVFAPLGAPGSADPTDPDSPFLLSGWLRDLICMGRTSNVELPLLGGRIPLEIDEGLQGSPMSRRGCITRRGTLIVSHNNNHNDHMHIWLE